MSPLEKKPNPYSKRNRIQTRVDDEELKQIEEKAKKVTGGDLSKFIRVACLEYNKKKSLV